MNLLAMLIGALPMQRSTLDLFAVSVINILATPSIDVVPMLRASGDVYTIWTKVSTCIYFAFAIHLRIAGSVGFDDVVLMSRLRFNTPCFQHLSEEQGVCLYGKGGSRSRSPDLYGSQKDNVGKVSYELVSAQQEGGQRPMFV